MVRVTVPGLLANLRKLILSLVSFDVVAFFKRSFKPFVCFDLYLKCFRETGRARKRETIQFNTAKFSQARPKMVRPMHGPTVREKKLSMFHLRAICFEQVSLADFIELVVDAGWELVCWLLRSFLWSSLV